jgi:hypothetical protein
VLRQTRSALGFADLRELVPVTLALTPDATAGTS